MACKKCGLAMVLDDGNEDTDRSSQDGPQIVQMNGKHISNAKKPQNGFIWSKIRVLKKVRFKNVQLPRYK